MTGLLLVVVLCAGYAIWETLKSLNRYLATGYVNPVLRNARRRAAHHRDPLAVARRNAEAAELNPRPPLSTVPYTDSATYHGPPASTASGVWCPTCHVYHEYPCNAQPQRGARARVVLYRDGRLMGG